MSETSPRATKRQRTNVNPFVDQEAVVVNDEESESDDAEEADGFIVDDTTEPTDHLSFDTSITIPAALNHEQHAKLDHEYEELVQRAKERARMGEQTDISGQFRVNNTSGMHDRFLTVVQEHKAGVATWVRMRRLKGKLGVYVGDIALAISTTQPTEFEFWLVPRPKLKNRIKGMRPIQMLFRAVVDSGKDKTNTEQFLSRGSLYSREGFLILNGPPTLAASFGGQVLPTPHEFGFFTFCEVLPPSFRRQTEERMAQNMIVTGDRVKCIGELQGLTGFVQDASEDTVTVYLPSMDLMETVMRYEVRKEFRIGDQVLISTGDDGEDKSGWIVAVNGTSISVFERKEHVEINCSSQQLRFNDEARTMVDLRKISALSFTDRRSMRDDPNAKLIGKQVMVVGAHHYKGMKGTIRDISFDGWASVSLGLFNHPRSERFKLGELRLHTDNDPVEILPSKSDGHPSHTIPQPPDLPDTGPSEHDDTTNAAVLEPTDDSTLKTTPPDPDTTESLTLEAPTWLMDPRMSGLRILVELPGQTTRPYEVRSIVDEVVTVRDGMTSKQFQLGEIFPRIPSRREDVVVAFGLGEYFGQKFRIKEFGPRICVLRKYGERRTTQKEKLYHIPTAKLCVIYPPKR